ncbi:MAG: hypothetical protein AB1442_09650, partial [Nitrospirota bacterium]
EAGQTRTIRWVYPPGLKYGCVKIELLKGGQVNKTVAYARIGSGGHGSYVWKIPMNQAVGGDYSVRVTNIFPSATDTSNGYFDITAPSPPAISVVTPGGGEMWKKATLQTVRWTYTGNIGILVRIELLKDGIVYPCIPMWASAGFGGSGSYNYLIPFNAVPGGNYAIRITSVTYPAIMGVSDSFTISP